MATYAFGGAPAPVTPPTRGHEPHAENAPAVRPLTRGRLGALAGPDLGQPGPGVKGRVD